VVISLRKLLFLTVIVVLAISVYAGANYDGMDFANGVTVGGTATIRVHQWLDINSVTERVNNVDIYEYDQEYTYDPNGNAIMMFFVVITNADLKLKVEGELYDKEGQVELGYVRDNLFKVKYVFYEYSPTMNTYYPADENGAPLWKDLGDEITLTNETCVNGDNQVSQSLGLGMKFLADKDLPAGEYKFVYNVVFNPTVTF